MTTRQELNGIIKRIAQELPDRRWSLEHGTGYWTLYEEEPGHCRQVLHGRTKDELWSACHAFLSGVAWARESDHA